MARIDVSGLAESSLADEGRDKKIFALTCLGEKFEMNVASGRLESRRRKFGTVDASGLLDSSLAD
jgi:hypothetical protein